VCPYGIHDRSRHEGVPYEGRSSAPKRLPPAPEVGKVGRCGHRAPPAGGQVRITVAPAQVLATGSLVLVLQNVYRFVVPCHARCGGWSEPGFFQPVTL
jgi:hypothetical protein